MGTLAHFLETDEVPTTQISLIREHTAIIQPPRALWVPFELGRPLGLPDDPSFQRRVLLAALELLGFDEGPVLIDFPENVPGRVNPHESSLAVRACPVSFTSSSKGETETESIISSFKCELAKFRSWYDLGLDRRGYTGVACFPPDAAFALLSDFALGKPVRLPESIASTAAALRLAAQDIKAFYFEAVIARPNSSMTESAEFTNWFWQETVAGAVLRLVKEICLSSDDKQLAMTGGMLLIPMDQA